MVEIIDFSKFARCEERGPTAVGVRELLVNPITGEYGSGFSQETIYKAFAGRGNSREGGEFSYTVRGREGGNQFYFDPDTMIIRIVKRK